MSPPDHNPETTYRQPRQDTNSEYVPRRYVTGIPRVSSKQSELRQGSGSTMSPPSINPRTTSPELPGNPDTGSSTPESLRQNRKKIWNARSSLCLPNSPDIKSYETSVRELIGQDPDLKPFFDTAFKDLYESSSLPTETSSPGWPSNYFNSSLKKLEESSWFSANLRTAPPVIDRSSDQNPSWRRICFPSSTSSPPDTTGGESTRSLPETNPSPVENPVENLQDPKEEATTRPRKRIRKSKELSQKNVLIRARRIRILPDEHQREILKDCFGIHRHIFNECVNADKNGLVHGASAQESSRWRTLLTKRENYYNVGKNWKDRCPSHTKQQAVEEYFKAKKTGMKMVHEKKMKRFDLKFKSRFKMTRETIPFERYSLKKPSPESKQELVIPYQGKSIGFRISGKLPKEFRDRDDPKSLRKEVKITRTRLGKYYVHIPTEVEQKSKFPGESEGELISFDPGSKTFLTYHTPDGSWGEIGTFKKQEELLHEADRMRSKMDSGNSGKTCRSRRHLRRKFLGILEKVRNRTADLHNKVCSWVVNNFQVVLLPIFETSQMVSSGNLYSSTCRKMMTWSHYSFQRKLVDLAQKFTDVKVRLCNEAFTTKQCGRCGVVNRNMTLNDRIFHCSGCSLTSSRDGHAARNVGIRSLKFLVN